MSINLDLNLDLSHPIARGGFRPFPESESLYITRQIIEAITILAENGIAHRDIKPDNILIDPQTLRIKLIDFGLASLIDDEEATDNAFVGTPLYMAPQILQKKEYHVVAADMWSAGMTLLEMLREPILLKTFPHSQMDARCISTALRLLQPGSLCFNGLGSQSQTVLQGLLTPVEALRFDLTDAVKALKQIKPVKATHLRPSPRSHDEATTVPVSV